MIRSAPCRRQPITAPRPTRPQPKTAHVEPGSTRAVNIAAPMPVERPQAKTAAAVERRLRVDHGEGDLRHHRVLGERRRAHEVPQRLAAAREPRRAVGQVAEALLVADRDAAVRARALAVHALPALRGEQRHDVVARLHERHAGADPLDDARALVPEHAGRVARGVGARRGVEVGVADAARDEAHQHLAGLRLGQVDAPGRRAASRTPRAPRRGSSCTPPGRGQRILEPGCD